MPMSLIDTHAHLDEEAFEPDRDEIVTRATEAGLQAILTIGLTLSTSRAAVELAEKYPNVYAVVGIQPNYVHEVAPGDWEAIQALADHPRVVGIGETGLDRYWDYAPLDLQVEHFQQHMAFARQKNLPFIVHCRDAAAEVLEQLKIAAAEGPLVGVMHSFCDDLETARACLDMGMHISFSGMVTFKKAANLRDLAKEIPLDRILVETDAPYLAPTPRRGKRNEPSYVRYTAACLAEVHGMTPEAFGELTTRNACQLFGLELG
ncbi:putative deoxyribonuclease YcfH [Symmachiella dynata]|uniref:Putative deoxyribonuclease YcfH n=1 Tax=Symmachiella dynata TaxID=2527995 RepID=A0A517ZTV5_9PLAN|nr:TatD family hydrolase [Symmachiella dynata]QDU45900.1 putative deoxyribonuclease YcfH [Symmachiella dynata]